MPDYADPRPVKVQIADDLREQVKSGTYAPGDKLPPVRKLADDYGVVTGTVRDAVDILRREGLVQTRSTRGTYVLRPPAEPEPSQEYLRLTERLAELADRVAAVDDLADRLAVVEHLVLGKRERDRGD